MKKWTVRAGLVAASFSVALIVVEIALRLLGSAPAGQFTVSQRDFERLPGIWEPHQSALVRGNPALPYHFSTDSLGYRGSDFPRQKPDGQFRVFYVGDSFTFGSFVDNEETLPARLQARLAEACPNTLVVNAGLGGSTITEHRPMIERGLPLDPDLVILQFSENDVTDLAGPTMWQRLSENRQTKSSFPISLVYPTLRRTAIWRLALRARAVFVTNRRQGEATSRDRGTDTGPSDTSAVDLLRDRYKQLLVELSDTLDERGYPLLFVVYPSHHTLYGTGSTDQVQWLTQTAEEIGLPVVDLTGVLAETGENREQLYLLPHDGHPSARGYDVAVTPVAEAIQRNLGLPGTSCR